MYPYEERIRAVKLYIALGKRVATTIHRSGYPTENALKSWHREYECCLDLPHAYARSKPKYSQAQVKMAVEHYLERGRGIAATSRRWAIRHGIRCVPGFSNCPRAEYACCESS